MVHAAAAAAARALARAIREYAKRRLIDHYLVEVADNAVAIPIGQTYLPLLLSPHTLYSIKRFAGSLWMDKQSVGLL